MTSPVITGGIGALGHHTPLICQVIKCRSGSTHIAPSVCRARPATRRLAREQVLPEWVGDIVQVGAVAPKPLLAKTQLRGRAALLPLYAR